MNYLQHDEVILQKIPIILLSYAHGFPPPHVWTHPLKRELCFNRSQPICLEVGRGNFRPVFGCRQYTSISEKDLLQRTYNFPLKQTRCIFVIPKCDLIKSMKWCRECWWCKVVLFEIRKLAQNSMDALQNAGFVRVSYRGCGLMTIGIQQ